MCFLLLHHATRSDHPLVLLANRDEYFDRPFERPALRDPARGIVAPRDLRAGGTWLGTNHAGLVVAITNRGRGAFDGVRSRGNLVLDALQARSANDAVDWAKAHLAETSYAGFNLLMADGRDAWVIRHPGDSVARDPRPDEVVRLAPGAHVLSNLHDLDEVDVPALGRPDPDEAIADTFARLRALAGDDTTDLPGGHRILKRGDGRGTVCSAVLSIATNGARTFEFADGLPGEAPFLSV